MWKILLLLLLVSLVRALDDQNEEEYSNEVEVAWNDGKSPHHNEKVCAEMRKLGIPMPSYCSAEEIESAIGNTQNEEEVKDIFYSNTLSILSGGRRRRRFRRALDESEDSEEFEVAEPEVELSEEEQQLAGTDVTAAALGATGAATAGTALAKALFAGRRRRRFRRSLFVINSGTLAQSRRRDRRRDGRRRRFRRALDESEDSEEFEVAEPEVELSEEEQQLADFLNNASEEEIESAIGNTQNEEEVKAIGSMSAAGTTTVGTTLATALFAGRRRRRFRRSLFVLSYSILKDSRRRDGRRRRFRRALDESEDSEEFEVAEPEVELSEEEQQLADFLNNASEEEIESAIANAQNEEEVKAILSAAILEATTALPYIIKYGKKYWPTIKKWGKKVWNNRKKHWNNAKKGFKKFGSKVKKGWNKVFGGRRRRKFRRALDDSEDSKEFEVAEPEVELSEEEQQLADFLSNASEDQIADSFSEEELAETEGMSEEEVSDWFLKGLFKKIKKAGRKAGRWGSKAFKSVKKKVSGRGF